MWRSWDGIGGLDREGKGGHFIVFVVAGLRVNTIH